MTLLDILIRRLRIIPVRKGEVSIPSKATVMAELAGLGYRVKNPEDYTDSVLEDYGQIISGLKALKGGDVLYVPLFTGFPEKAPEQNEYFVKRLVGYLVNLLELPITGPTVDVGFVSSKLSAEANLDDTELAGSITVPEWLFDLQEFGADPITQLQDEGLFLAGAAKQAARKGDTHVEWVDLEFVEESEAITRAKNFLNGVLYAKSSIKEALAPDIEFLLDYFGVFGDHSVDPAKVVFKEIRTFIMKFHWNREDFDAVSLYVDTPTDLLRLFATLTDSDVSLAAPIKFPKFNRRQRRFVVSRLNGCSSLAEDLVAYKGLWLALGRSLHLGEFASKFPSAYKAFNLLRNAKIQTYNGEVEEAFKAKDLDGLLELLTQRPGVFARRIHQVLELASNLPHNVSMPAFGTRAPEALQSFSSVVGQVQLKNLLVLHRYFSTIEDSPLRTIINKRGKIRVMDNRQNRLQPSVVGALLGVLVAGIEAAIVESKDAWQAGSKVWIDPALRNYTVPLQQRKASDGLLTLGRGTRMPLEKGAVLRLFVWWKQAAERTDLDLSLISYDDQMNYTGHVSYTNLASGGMQHSGDIQSAPKGAAEFIDIDLAAVRKGGSRYIATQILRYSGEHFGTCECHAGWMIRDKVTSNYKTFDIKTVQNKFDVTGAGSYAIPIIVDLQENEIIFVDLFMRGVDHYNRVEGAYQDISVVTKEIARMIETRPNMFDLATFHRDARGAESTEDRDQADITFGLSDCDYNVNEFERILSELL